MAEGGGGGGGGGEIYPFPPLNQPLDWVGPLAP